MLPCFTVKVINSHVLPKKLTGFEHNVKISKKSLRGLFHIGDHTVYLVPNWKKIK